MVQFVGAAVPLSQKAQGQLEESLRCAGIKKTAHEYFATLVILYLGVAIILFTVCKFLLRQELIKIIGILLFALFAFYTAARFFIGKKITGRTERIEDDLPEILDLLSVSVSAGLGFDQALQYVVDRCDGELSEELAITQREIHFGRSRNEALKRLADRCKVEPLRMFVSSILQADTLGIPISNVLQVQAENVRQQHKQRIEEKAAKLPVKILFPLVFFIFPVMFIVLLGPALPKILAAF